MKKTVTANLSGTVFHIEEDAYDRLQRYLGSIRDKFRGSGSMDDIMSDIEARVAELFTERLTGRNVVTLEDVEHVETVMGRPEDFAGEEATADGAPKAKGPRAHRRLLRDTDDKWVAGVLSGLAAYIGTEVIWLRVAFIALVYFGWGSPILFYLILWLLVPRAITAAEKLEMRGEPVTAENIKRMFEEGADDLKRGAERVAGEARDLGKDFGPKAQAWSQEFRGTARSTASTAGTILVKLIGAFILFVGIVAAIALFAGTVSAAGFTLYGGANEHGMDLVDLGGLVTASAGQAWWALLGLFVFCAVPVVTLLLLGMRMVFHLRSPRWLIWSLVGLWFSSLALLAIIGIRTGTDFRDEAKARTELSITAPTDGPLEIGAIATDSLGSTTFSFSNGVCDMNGNDGLYVSDGMIHCGWAELDVEQSPDSLYHLIMTKESRGRNPRSAAIRAGNMSHAYVQEGNVLRVSPWFTVPTADKLRAQQLQYTVQVPVGGMVHFLRGSDRVIYDVDNITNTLDEDMVGRTWTMTREGLRAGTADEPAPADTTRREVVERAYHRLPKASPQRPVVPVATTSANNAVELPNLYRLLGRAVTL